MIDVTREMRIIAENVKSLRISKNLTQEELAVRCGLPAPRISEIERGCYDSRVSTIARVAKALGVAAASLLIPAEAEILSHSA